jgi:hypothetical protein
MAIRAVAIVVALAALGHPGNAIAREYRTKPHPPSHFYLNQDSNRVHRPVYNNVRPSGATTQCADGTWSFSQHRRGTCSYHGGVASW